MKMVTIDSLDKYVDKDVEIKGWVYNRRSVGKIWFLILRDGTGLLQCVVVNGECDKDTFNHWADKSNKSKVHQIDYEFNSGDVIAVQCVDWSKKITDENGWKDSFRVTLFDKETSEFLRSLN